MLSATDASWVEVIDAGGQVLVQRVLQPGESFNGISLQSVDVQAGRATFSAAGGKPFTLQLHEAAQ